MISLQGRKVAFSSKWHYTLYYNGREYDSFISTRKLTAEEMISVERGYDMGLDGYRPPTLV